MPPKHKAKSAPNQHDKRHESGLAPPGKRVVKKTSNAHLDAPPNGKPAAPVSPSPLPPSGLNHASKASHPSDAPESAEPAPDDASPPPLAARERFYSEASLDEAGQWGDMGDGFREPVSATPPSEPSPSVQRQASYTHTATSSSSSISTLLTYYPLRDAISILILLLSLPPTLVLVIQTLFASLTFVPPAASISLSTLPNIKEIFNSSNFGYPALATILIVDLLFWVAWLSVWRPMQPFLLDLSQAVIAISLSGAAASPRGVGPSITSCVAVVVAVHFFQLKEVQLPIFDYLRSLFKRATFGVTADVPFYMTHFSSASQVERGWLYTVAHTILGIHIVSQGFTTFIRQSLIKANERNHAVPTITRSDAEPVTGAEPAARSNSLVGDAGAHSNAAQSTDGRPPGPSPAQRDGRPRESVHRRRRKQATQVRSQQPLWAAIASTKVSFIKEMEQRDVIDDAREAARMEAQPSVVSTTTSQANTRIWICDVRDNGFFFSIDLPADATIDPTENAEASTGALGQIDRSKPFYVRINGAAWGSTCVAQSSDSDRHDGEIFGLAPLSSYSCEIVSTANQKVLCSANVITQAAPTDEQAVTASSQSQPPNFRPSSPTTTLNKSIQQAEAKLHEARNRMKKNKKDQRAAHADIKREINTLRSKLETSGGSDDRQERRLLQITQHKSQAEEAAEQLRQQVEALGEIPAADVAESEARRKQWQAALDAKNAAQRELDQAKTDAYRELSTLKSEISQTESKHERLAARLAQRTHELQTLVSKQQADATAKQQRDSERAQTLQRRRDEKTQFQHHIASFESELQAIQQKAQDSYQEILALQNWSSGPPQGYHTYSSPPTPDNAFTGTSNGAVGSPHQSNGYSKFASQPFQTSHHSAQPSLSNPAAPPATRGRSSSMLSQYSGFTDNGEEYAFAPGGDQPTRPYFASPADGGAHVNAVADGSGSGSLASGSTGSNSPRPDARTFASGRPIAPPGKNKDRKATQSPPQQQGSSGR